MSFWTTIEGQLHTTLIKLCTPQFKGKFLGATIFTFWFSLDEKVLETYGVGIIFALFKNVQGEYKWRQIADAPTTEMIICY